MITNKEKNNNMTIKIDLSKDKLFDTHGLARLKDGYMRDDETSPQERYAFVSKAFASNEEHAQRIYEYASNHWLSFSTQSLHLVRTKVQCQSVATYHTYQTHGRD